MRIRLTAERRERALAALQRFSRDELDRELSPFQAERLLDFLVVELGAPVYNQAIQDARGFLLEKLDDLEGEFYEPDEPQGEFFEPDEP